MSAPIHLLACDLDGTVIPLDDGDEHRNHVRSFRDAVERAEGLVLAYVTGRHYEHALRGIEEHGLPLPDYLACEVGTSVRVRDGARYEVDEAYRGAMAESLGADADEVRAALSAVAGLELQPDPQQGEFKASYFTAWPVSEDTLAACHACLDEMGARANLVASHDRDTGRGLVDALPAGVAKDRAVMHLAERAGVRRARVVYAGDSGNDSAALLSGVQGIVVGNAPDYLVEELRDEASRRGLEARLHFARAWYAAGVLEGCRHFGVL